LEADVCIASATQNLLKCFLVLAQPSGG
jgi:hypothetical protein